MQRHLSLVFLLVCACPAFAQPAAPIGNPIEEPVPAAVEVPAAPAEDDGLLKGDRAFPNFIGWVSNPTKAIDPRSLTQIWPVFGSAWTNSVHGLPSGNVQIYGPGVSVALTERLEVGINNGGYAVSHFDKHREGWLNLGSFVQYTLIRDIPDQFIVSGGLAWVFPWGESDVFQGHGPTKMSTYLTAGKEIGNFHVLTTNGFSFPISPGKNETTLFYGSLHIDRKCGRLYPLVEFNYGSAVSSVNLDIPVPHDFLSLAGVNPSLAMVTVAPGMNVVLIPNRLELGAVYQTPIAAEHDFRFQEVLVKMVLRY